jgi:type IX secretion system PorP/SprF family membrane protein
MKKFIAIITMLAPLVLLAQQDGMISQMTMNKVTLNPGYAGYREKPVLMLAHRQQWVGFKGAPHTSVLSFDMPFEKKKELAVGASLIQTKLGPTSKTELNAYAAVRVRLSNRAIISWGMTAGARMYQVNLGGLKAYSENLGVQDDALMYNTKGYITPNVGVGCFYYNAKGYFGASLPRLITATSVSKHKAESQNFGNSPSSTLYLMGGRMEKVNKKVTMTYNGFFTGSFNSPVSLGGYVTCIYDKNYTFGLYYAIAENVGLIFQAQINRDFKIGYTYDLSANGLIRANYGSHEFSLSYSFKSMLYRVSFPRLF